MPALRLLTPIAFAVVMAALLAAGLFGHVRSLELIQVLDIAPHDLEVGDRLAIVGAGFPPGKPARVTFRGNLHRAGESAQRGVVIEATGTVVNPERVELEIDEAIQSLFCRGADGTVHTTFEGELEVAFAAAASGAAPVGGVLKNVALDVRPSAKPFDVDREREGERFLTFEGLRSASATRESGVIVRDVAAGSAAEAAGIVAGDLIVRFDGVRVETLSDVLPVPGEHEAEIGIRRGGASDEIALRIVVRGFRRAPAAELLGAWLAVLTALLTVLLLATRAPAPISRAIERAVSRARAAGAGAPNARRAMLHTIGPATLAALSPSGPTGVIDIAVYAYMALMPFGQCLLAAKGDASILFVAAATALAVTGVVGAGSPRRALSALLHVFWQHVPSAVAVASVVQTTGSFCIREVERMQGGWPWEWSAFRSPASLLAMLLLIQCARTEPTFPPRPRPPGWVGAIGRGHRLVIAGLVGALFLGGWSLPGLTPAQQDSRPVLEVAGALVYLGKLIVVAAAIGACRWMTPAGNYRDETRRTAVALVPVSVACFLFAALYNGWGPPAALQLLASASLIVVALFVVIGFARRLHFGLSSGTADAHLSPFL